MPYDGGWLEDDTGATTVAAAPTDIEELLAINVKRHGAVGDGIANDTAAIIAALVAAFLVGGDVYFPAGRYRVTSTIAVPGGITLRGAGAGSIIDGTGLTATTIMVQALGTLGAGILLTGDATKMAFSLNVADASTISAGDYVKVSSTASFGANPRGEILRVRSVVGNTLNFYLPLCDTYTVAATGQIQKANLVPEITIRDLKFAGPVNEGIQVTGLHFELCRNILVDGCRFEHTNYVGTAVWDVIDWTVRDCTYRDDMLPGFAYGISIGWASADGLVTGCKGERMRHLVTHGGGSSRRGVVRRIGIVGNQGRCTDAMIDSHAASDGIVIADNTVYNSNEDTAGTSHDGIISQGANTTIVGNKVYGTSRSGIFLQSETLEPDTSYLVSNNYVERALTYGIVAQVLAGDAPIKGLTVTGNMVKSAGIRGIWIDAAVAAFEDVNVSDNIVRSPGTDGIRLNNLSNFIAGNNIVSGITGGNRGITIVSCTDGVVEDNVVRADAASSCIVITGSSNVDANHNRCPTGSFGVQFDNACTNCSMTFNDATGCTTPYNVGTGAGHIVFGNRGATTIRTVVSASTITLGSSEGDIYTLSGTATVDTITATGMAGRRATLINSATAGLSDGVGNLRLAGAYVGTADDTITLVCNGTNWFEQARSVN